MPAGLRDPHSQHPFPLPALLQGHCAAEAVTPSSPPGSLSSTDKADQKMVDIAEQLGLSWAGESTPDGTTLLGKLILRKAGNMLQGGVNMLYTAQGAGP